MYAFPPVGNTNLEYVFLTKHLRKNNISALSLKKHCFQLTFLQKSKKTHLNLITFSCIPYHLESILTPPPQPCLHHPLLRAPLPPPKEWYTYQPAYCGSLSLALSKWGIEAPGYSHSRMRILPVSYWLPGSLICLQILWQCLLCSHQDCFFQTTSPSAIREL